jgi:AcrR family transcriptional regulator
MTTVADIESTAMTKEAKEPKELKDGKESERDAETKAKILHAARDLFFEFGPSRVKMEEIAERLAMSKKTLYKHYTSKDDVLQAVTEDTQCEMQAIMADFIQSLGAVSDEEFLRRLAAALEHLSQRVSTIWQSPFLKDIQRSYPQIWQEFGQRRRQNILTTFQTICNEAVRREMLRSDVNYNLFTLMYLSCVENVMNPTLADEFKMTGFQIFQMMMRILFGGVMTDKGRDEAIGLLDIETHTFAIEKITVATPYPPTAHG